MINRKNYLWYVFAGLVLFSFLTVSLFIQQGEFQTIGEQSEYQCQPIAAPWGPEDIVADYDTGLLYISASARQDGAARFNTRGNIHVLDMNGANEQIQLVSGDFIGKFRPHGMSLIKLADGSKRLFAISHPAKAQSVVEIFAVKQAKLTHIETISGLPGGLNSITAIDGERFYATQDGSTSGISSLFNGIFGLEYSEVIYYDGKLSQVVADGFEYANGIELSADGQQLYVADMLKRTLEFYDRDLQTNALTKTGNLNMDAGVDNISRNQDGSFFIAGHPKMFSTFFHISGLKDIAPSVVFRATPPKGGQRGELKVVHLENGFGISGASGAVEFNDKMYIGAITQNRLLSCIKL